MIFGPMFHVGCLSASWGVTSSSSSRLRPRNGPPEPVRTSESTCSGARPSRHWNAAECSLSTGSHETLLVRQGQRDAALERPERRRQAREADNRVQDDVWLRALQQLRQVAADLGQWREPVERLGSRGGGDELELRVALHDLDGLAADRAGRPEQGYTLHVLKVYEPGLQMDQVKARIV